MVITYIRVLVDEVRALSLINVQGVERLFINVPGVERYGVA